MTRPATDTHFGFRAGAARRQAGAGRRRLPHGRAPLRPDERPDVGRAAPAWKDALVTAVNPPKRRRGRSRCSIVAGGTGDIALPRGRRPAAPARAPPSATSTPTCSRSAASARPSAASTTPSTFVEGNAEALPFPDRSFDAVHHRLRHPQRAAHRRGARRGAIACSSSAAASSASNSPPSTCRGSMRSTTSIRSTSSRRSAAR